MRESVAYSYAVPVHVHAYTYVRQGRTIHVPSFTYYRWVIEIPEGVELAPSPRRRPSRRRTRRPPVARAKRPRKIRRVRPTPPKKKRKARPKVERPESPVVRIEKPKPLPAHPKLPPELLRPETPPEDVREFEGVAAELLLEKDSLTESEFVALLRYHDGEAIEPFGWNDVRPYLDSIYRSIQEEGFHADAEVPIYHDEKRAGSEFVEVRNRFLYKRRPPVLSMKALGGMFIVLVRSWHLVVFPNKKPKKRYAIFTRHDVVGIVTNRERKYERPAMAFGEARAIAARQCSEVSQTCDDMAEGYAEYRGLIAWTCYVGGERRPGLNAEERLKHSWKTRRKLYGKSGKRRTKKKSRRRYHRRPRS
jgi:hypothetical protein